VIKASRLSPSSEAEPLTFVARVDVCKRITGEVQRLLGAIPVAESCSRCRFGAVQDRGERWRRVEPVVRSPQNIECVTVVAQVLHLLGLPIPHMRSKLSVTSIYSEAFRCGEVSLGVAVPSRVERSPAGQVPGTRDGDQQLGT
jgi:hypothetical protein